MSLLSSDFREIAIYMFVFYSTILMYSMVPGVIMLAVEQRNGSRVVFRWIRVHHLHYNCHDGVIVNQVTDLLVTKYRCHKWPQICSVCRKHNPFLPHWYYYGFVARLTYRMWYYWSSFPLIIPPFTLVFSGARIAKMFVLCIIVYRSSLVLWSIFYLYSLYCLSCLHLPLLIVPLVSNFS